MSADIAKAVGSLVAAVLLASGVITDNDTAQTFGVGLVTVFAAIWVRVR